MKLREPKAELRFDLTDTEKTPLLPDYKVCGVLWDTYILVQMEEKCYIIDQHAAHERFLYDRYLEEYLQKKVVTQELLVPEILEAEPFVLDLVGENIEVLASIGFEIELFGGNSCLIRGVPSLLCGTNFTRVFEEALMEIERSGNGKKVIDQIAITTLMQTSCKHAVKGNQRLTDEEIRFILDAFVNGKEFTCPHGRPIAVIMSRKDLEHRFGRS